MPAKTCVVMTTINDGAVLASYCDGSFLRDSRDDVQFVVIPDRKTPEGLFAAVSALQKAGVQIECPTLGEQESYLSRFPQMAPLIPYNSDNRRNIGYLKALEAGCDVMVSIDDDNFCTDTATFYAQHRQVAGPPARTAVVDSRDNWYNICDMLALEPDYPVYPRGYPYRERHRISSTTVTQQEVTVRMNAGLWLNDPDIDACTWLTLPVRATAQSSPSIVLGHQTWSPVNTQNTALHRHVIPTFYYVRMGYPLMGLPIDRYGDILAGYFSQACVKAMGHSVRVGTPLVDHRRNSHDYLTDLANELAGMWIIEELSEWLTEARLEGATYPDVYACLADHLEEQVELFTGTIWNSATRGYFHQVAYAMRAWIGACSAIGA